MRTGLLGKRELIFSGGGGGGVAIVTKKINLNLKYLTPKKGYKQVFFYVITKNSKWEILTKNLVRVKDEKFNILGVHRKIGLLRGEFMKNQYRRGGGLRKFADLRGAWPQGGDVFE